MKIDSQLRVKHTVQEWHVHVHVYMYIHTYMYYGKNFSQFAHALLHKAWKQTVMMYGMVQTNTYICTCTCTCIRGYNWGKHERAPSLCSLCSYTHGLVYVSYVTMQCTNITGHASRTNVNPPCVKFEGHPQHFCHSFTLVTLHSGLTTSIG